MKKIGLLIGAALLLLVLMVASIILGYTNTSLSTAIAAFTDFDGSNEHIIIKDVRLPRALIGASVGASLAVAGVLLQTLTKNPLASPSIFGLNAGASFFVVISLIFFHVSSLQLLALYAFIGATVAVVIVFGLGQVGGSVTPMKLTLAGAAITALFSSFTQGFLVLNEAALDQVLFWLAGSVQGRGLDLLMQIGGYLLLGFILAWLLSYPLNILLMGDDIATSLGVNTTLIRVGVLFAVVLLAGGSVAIAGPISFIGIMVPHIAKKIIGIEHQWLIPFAAFLGAILLVGADIAARYIIMPQEVPVGVMTAFIGVPFFIYIARKGFNGK